MMDSGKPEMTLFTSSAYKQVKGYKQIPETEKKSKR
jgi:hypothetical protein